MPISKKLALDEQQQEQMLLQDWNLRIATLDPNGGINLTPMWFGWSGGKVFIFGRGQKVENLRRNPNCTLLVDRNEKFPELQAIMMRGTARILESAEDEAAEPDLAAAQKQMGAKYNGGHGQAASKDPAPMSSSAAGRNRRWIVFQPERTVTWDNFKLSQLGT